MDDRHSTGLVIAIFAFILLSILAIPPYFEMQTFNKFRSEDQPKATFVDALFSKLRVNSN